MSSNRKFKKNQGMRVKIHATPVAGQNVQPLRSRIQRSRRKRRTGGVK